MKRNGDYRTIDVLAGKVSDEELRSDTFQTWFWNHYHKGYKGLIYSRPYQDLLKIFTTLVDVVPEAKLLDVGCSYAALPAFLWMSTKHSGNGSLNEIHGTDIVKPAWMDDPEAKESWIKFIRPWLAKKKNRKKMLWFHALSKEKQTEAIKEELDSMPLRYSCLDLKQIPYDLPENHYDILVSNMVLTYIPYCGGVYSKDALRIVFRNLHKALKPGGQFVWSTPKKGVNFIRDFTGSLFDMLYNFILPDGNVLLTYGINVLSHALMIQKLGKAGIYTFCDPVEYDEMLVDSGFRPLSWELSFAGQVWVNKSIKVV